MTEVTQQAQLDEPERRHLEKVVKQLRERAEETVEYWVHSKLNLVEEGAEAPATLSAEEQELRGRVEEAIEREQAGERSWAKARDLYVKGVGYTLVNRLAALRCMEVRGFLDRSPTRFRDDGVTPAADRLITDFYLPREAGIWTAFLVACQERSEEIEILFDLSDPYSLLYGDLTGWDGEPEELSWSDDLQSSLVDLLQDLGGLLDEVDDAVWRADDVLGWVYEYYNVPDLESVRSKVKTKEDAIAANQFYTPHWVVRMLVDNSLGKLFLQHEGELQKTIRHQAERFTPKERQNRDPRTASTIEELCTYLVATDEEAEAINFDDPSEIRVFDPACGSGHFLLYAFDVLERIWWEMAPDVSRAEIPAKILRHNLFGVDLDLRACQLAAFNLYLKARSRTEWHGAEDFELQHVNIVCSDAHVADLKASHEAFDEVSGDDGEIRAALNSILHSFEQLEGLGSLLDVKGTLAELIEESGGQLDAFTDEGALDLPILLDRLHETVSGHINEQSFRARDIRSFLKLLAILSVEYDVCLMNPPYGSKDRMPASIKSYLRNKYSHTPEYYINFFEVCSRLTKDGGMMGMLVPRTFMTRSRFESFRRDLLGGSGSFEFLSELGIGVLDNATVRTVATVVRASGRQTEYGIFIRLYDSRENKESVFSSVLDSAEGSSRMYKVKLSSFDKLPGAEICYSMPSEVINLHARDEKIDADTANIEGTSKCYALLGILSGNKDRFYRKHWEVSEFKVYRPIASGGADAWLLPQIRDTVNWSKDGEEMRRSQTITRLTNKDRYGIEGLTWTYIKETGRRFGYLPEGTLFSQKGLLLASRGEVGIWVLMAYLNSNLFTALMLSQTFEREWNAGEVGAAPWIEELSGKTALAEAAKEQYQIKVRQRTNTPISPYYTGPSLLPGEHRKEFYNRYPHGGSVQFELSSNGADASRSFRQSVKKLEDRRNRIEVQLQSIQSNIDSEIFKVVDISSESEEEIRSEIERRTGQDISEKPPSAFGANNTEKALKNEVRKVVHHIVLKVVDEDEDGIVLLRAESDEEEADLLAKMTAKFEEIWGQHAEDRLQEADEVLGNLEPTDEPYPNLRHWLENDLFAFHCGEFENTPILWELTTERLGEEDNQDAGFACLIDYHQLGPDVFDRLSARYLETRKAALRERQQSARRTAEGSEGTQAREARQEEKRCENALRQIDELETRISELTQTQPRDWADAVRYEARDLKPKVRRFRERLEERLETLDALHAEAPSSWFKDHFSDKFMESVGSNREEWIDALEDLEAACEQFARPADEPVKAHLYDLLPYFDDLVGSTHYSSNGIFFLNYYFSKGKDLAAKIDQGSKDRVTRREQLVADLARETDDDIELGKEINEACQAMKKHMDSDWKPRALEEVRTPGYRPVKKHGVAINITPLAEQKLVPELVDKKVL